MFKNETPLDIMERSVDSTLELVENGDGSLSSARVRLNMIKMLYDVLGFDLTPDAALASISPANCKLVLSTAGSGKTTWSQIIAILMKLLLKDRYGNKLHGSKILSLVYNKHNVDDMKSRHAQFVTRMRLAKIKGLDIDSEINACTMHSFCNFWRKQYTAQMGLIGYSLLEENQASPMMFRAINIAKKMMNYEEKAPISEKNLLSFYNLCKESLKEPAEMQKSDKFIDLGLDLAFVEKCFERYEAAKRLKKKYDYSDMLVKVYELLKNDEDAKAFVQRFYDFVIVDEVQDFTPIMWKILQLFVDNGTPMTCIGDEDQLIYQFRGASIDELLHFEQNFVDGKVFTLTKNRRCCKKILDEAIFAINHNELRFNKSLVGEKSGGNVELVPYNSIEGQVISVVERVKKLSLDEQRNTVICFREQICSQLLAEYLEENDIVFHSLQKVLPFSHEIYTHVLDVLNALEMPYDRTVSIQLYKVLPCTKAEVFEAFDYDAEHKKFNSLAERKHFSDYDYGRSMGSKGFKTAMQTLVEISNNIETWKMKDYFGKIYELLCKYFWTYKKSQKSMKLDSGEDIYEDMFDERAKALFSVDATYAAFFNDFTKRMGVCRSNLEMKDGVTISTFHGLKGLEFKNVYVIFLDDRVFPNYPLIESRKYEKSIEQGLKESEMRLWYVAITRAIENLYLYYNKNVPSSFVQMILDRERFGGEVKTETVDDFEGTFEDSFDDFDDFDLPEPEPKSETKPEEKLEETKMLTSFSAPAKMTDGVDVSDFELGRSRNDYLKNLINSL